MYGISKEAFEFHGNVQVKLEFYLDPADFGYEQTHIDVPYFTGAEYKGKKGKDGNPDPEQYQAWAETLPKQKQLNPFHSHFVYLPPDYSKADVETEIAFHLPNFYAAWTAGKSMRSGWDTAKRIRPVRFDKVAPEMYEAKRIACLSRVTAIEPILLATNGVGRTFPATNIDVGLAAVDRGIYFGANNYTLIVNQNAANDTGVIDTVEVWAYSTLGSAKVGLFYGSGTSYTPRDYASIGTVFSGAKRTYTGLSIDVETGDIIGLHSTYGYLEVDGSGGSSFYRSGDGFGGTNSYTSDNDQYSIYGTGETASVGARLLGLLGVGT